MLKDSQKIISIRILVVISLAFGCFISLHSILNGYSAFWFDPARDFMLALENLKKVTLIGSPTGIPGIFYGPYWIWLISTTLIFFEDPAMVITVLMVIPYFVIFPLILFKFTKILSTTTCLAILWLFFLRYGNYTNQLWNVNYAPLIFLLIIYLIIGLHKQTNNKLKLITLFLLAALSGLLVNFHFSFGFSVSIATAIFVVVTEFVSLTTQRKKLVRAVYKYALNLIMLSLGFIFIEIPFIIFETRHGFIQSKAILKTLTESILYNSAVVGQTGLEKTDIIKKIILGIPSQILNISIFNLVVIYSLLIGSFAYYLLNKKLNISKTEKHLFTFSVLAAITMTLVYTSSKNPIYDYHFYGFEIIVLLLVGLAVEKIGYFKPILYFWVFLLVITSSVSFFSNYSFVQYAGTPLWVKKAIVRTIYNDAKNITFRAYAYSPAIYTYDYDYLFLWLGTDYYKNLPQQNGTNNQVTYLIIPDTSEGIYYDFINYKTPNTLYNSRKIWVMIDGTTIIKRQPKAN